LNLDFDAKPDPAFHSMRIQIRKSGSELARYLVSKKWKERQPMLIVLIVIYCMTNPLAILGGVIAISCMPSLAHLYNLSLLL
jgi:hypothetical protein